MTAVKQSILNKNRKDKFLLVLNLPDVIKGINKTDQADRDSTYVNQDALQYSIYGTVVPDTSIPAVELGFAGQVVPVTSYNRPAWAPITVNFTVDNMFSNWWVLWKWLDLINDSYKGTFNAKGLKDPNWKFDDSYTTNVTVFGLDEYNRQKIQFDYTHVLITGLGGITYNYRDPDQIESTFTFSFGQFLPKLL